MRRLPTVLCIAALLAPASLLAQDRAPEWVRQPTARDFMGVFPRAALEKGVGGRATLGCIVTVQGTLRACRVEAQEPAEAGFGGAALALAPQFLLKPALKGGQPVEHAVRIPLKFDKPDKALGSFISPSSGGFTFQSNKVYSRLPYRAAPSVQEVLAAYPQKARERKAGGAVNLNCLIGGGGKLSSCSLIKEEPQGLGFARSARDLAAKFAVPDKDGQGNSLVGARTILLVTFAADSLDGTPTIGRPRWLTTPSIRDLAAVLPKEVLQAGAQGQVTMTCTIGPDGGLQGCAPASEQPTGQGYGQAAVALAPKFRAAIWTEEGLPTVGALVRVPVRFDVKAGRAPTVGQP